MIANNSFNYTFEPMGKKYHNKKLKKHHQNDDFEDHVSEGVEYPDKDKKIVKEPKMKQTILSDIELQIIDMFSRSFTNGQIGVKYPQQKKKGMMRLMNFCFRTIIQEAECYINPNIQKEAKNSKCVDKKQRTIFYLSSNYRYKHIEKSLLEDFKIICKNYVKYHSLEHLDPKFIEKFYKKIIHNDFCAEASDPFKNKMKNQNLDEVDEQDESPSQKTEAKKMKKQAKAEKIENIPPRGKTGAKRGRKRKYPIVEVDTAKSKEIIQTNEKEANDVSILSMIEPSEREIKSNRICIEKINIYLGYDSKIHGRKNDCEQNFANIQTHPFGRISADDADNRLQKKKWTIDMEAELIDQFMNTSASSPNIIIRNLMKKFGRNKLFVELEIQAKRKQMFKTSIMKFLSAFDGKTLCSSDTIKKMQISLRSMTLSPKNYFAARFIHDFYFKEVEAISVTLLSEYINKVNKDDTLTEKGHSQGEEGDEDSNQIEKKMILEREDLKYALSTMTKLVTNYNYDLIQ